MMTRRRGSAIFALILAGALLSGVSAAPRTFAAQADCAAYLTRTTVPDGGGGDRSTDGLNAVDAVDYDDVWTVGQNPSDGALIDHWDGTSWTISLSGASYGRLFAVSFDSPTDGWAGGQGEPGGQLGPLMEHWTGSAWSIVTLRDAPSDDFIVGIAALSPTNVWALVTNYGTTDAEHWNGSAWKRYPLQVEGGWFPGGMTADSPTDVWAVGYATQTNLPLAWHWNGHAWSRKTLPLPPGASNGELFAVSSLSPTDVWAAGGVTVPAYAPLVEHWDGNAWTPTATPPPSERDPLLSSISMVSDTNGWAAGWGRYKNSGAVQYFVQHWDGNSWSLVDSPSEKSTILRGISALPAAGPWAAGQKYGGTAHGPFVIHACPDQVRDAGFVPADDESALGSEMEWSFPLRNDSAHRVEDGSGLGLFSSPPEERGQVFLYDYIEAGRYAVRDPSTGHVGVVSVPMTASPHSGDTGTKYTITWASKVAAQGYVFDVQIERPGSSWDAWFTGLTSTMQATFRTRHPGTYRFRARYRSTGGATSDWSHPVAIVVG
jgi:hypothetical protein